MAGARYGEVNWRRKKSQCHGGKGTLSMERQKGDKEREVERVWFWVHTRGTPLGTTDWGVRGTQCPRFFANSLWSSNSEVLGVYDFLQSGAVVFAPGEEGAGPGVDRIVW